MSRTVSFQRPGGNPVEIDLDLEASCSELKHRLADRLEVHRFEIQIVLGMEAVEDDTPQSVLVGQELSVLIIPFLSPPVIEKLIDRMREKGVEFGPGLTDEEVVSIEKLCSIQLPPDLKAFLQTALPLSTHFQKWREIKEPTDFNKDFEESVLFDMEHNDFWFTPWGARPDGMAERLSAAQQNMSTAPRLIPIFAHRCMASTPQRAGQPVLSIHDSAKGTDLAAYFAREFGFDVVREALEEPLVQIPFWGSLDGAPEADPPEAQQLGCCR